MGTPLAPIMSEYFLRKLEKKFADDHKEIKFYYRFMDDIFLVAEDSLDSNMIQNWFNNCHPKIKFSIEMEEENKINYLDVLIFRKQTTFETTLFRKKVHPLLFQRFNSFLAPKYKRNLISCMVNRLKRICSTDAHYTEQKLLLVDMFIKSGYPEKFVLKNLNEAENRFRLRSKLQDGVQNETRRLFFGLSYFGKNTTQYLRRLKSNFDRLKLPSTSEPTKNKITVNGYSLNV